jgi:hypothetical protein
LQDQLSVVRASLLQHLAHKAALELKVKQQHSSNGAAVVAAAAQKLKLAGAPEEDGADAAGCLQDDIPLVAGGSPKRRGKPEQLDQASRTSRASSPGPLLQHATADADAASTHSALLQQPAAAAAADDDDDDEAAEARSAQQQAEAVTAGDISSTLPPAAEAAEPDAGGIGNTAQAAGVSAGSAAVLLTAAAKLQRLVEQLTQREPAVAADLSLLQWQLTTAFGHMTGAPSRNGNEMLLVGQSSGSSKCQGTVAEMPVVAEEGEATVAVERSSGIADSSSNSSNTGAWLQTPTTPAGSVKLLPADAHPLADEAAAAAAAAAGHPAQHSAAEVAAAARLFSGAATTLQAPSIDWYYLEEGGSVRGGRQGKVLD